MTGQPSSVAFCYSAEQERALLAPLSLAAGIDATEIARAVTEAARRAIESEAEHSAAPPARDVIEELKQIETHAQRLNAVLGAMTPVMDGTPSRYRTLRAMMRRRRFDMPPQAMIDDLLDLAESAKQAQLELSGHGPLGSPFALDGVLTFRESGRKSAAGRAPKAALGQFGLDLALIYRLATGLRPTVPKKDGHVYGPFHDFLEAAVRPTGLLQDHRRVGSLAGKAKGEFDSWSQGLNDIHLTENQALLKVAARLRVAWRAATDNQ